MNVEKGHPKRLVRCVTCPTFIRIAYRAARQQKNVKGVETKIQIKSLCTSSYNIFSLPTINLCNGIYHFNFRHIGNTLVTVFFYSSSSLITQPRQTSHLFCSCIFIIFIKSIYTHSPNLLCALKPYHS